MAVTVEERIMKLTLENAQAITNARKYQQAMMGIADSTKEAARGAVKMKGASNGLMSSFGRRGIGGAVQQAGYQVADFAIVLQQGQGAMRAFAVQGGQLISSFGPWGAAVGGVVTVGGLLIQSWLDMRVSAKELSEAIDEAVEAIQTLQRAESELLAARASISETSWLERIVGIRTKEEALAIAGAVDSIGESIKNAVDAAAEAQLLLDFEDESARGPGMAAQQAASAALASFKALTAEAKVLQEQLESAVGTVGSDEVQRSFDSFAQSLYDTGLSVEDIESLLVGIIPLVDKIVEREKEHERLLKVQADRREEIRSSIEGAKVLTELMVNSLVNVASGIENAVTRASTLRSTFSDIYQTMLLMAKEDARQKAYYNSIYHGTDTGTPLTPDGIVLAPPTPPEETGGGCGREEVLRLTKEQIAAQKEYDKQLAAHNNLLEDMKVSYQDLAESGVGGFVDMLFDAETSFADFARTFLIQIGKMIAQQLLLNAITTAFGGKGGASLTPPVLGGAGVTAFAKGGVINTPTIFPMGNNQTGIAGEAGAEAIMPLKRGSNGELGVAGPQITINNNAGAEISVTRSDDEVIEIAVNRATKQTQAEFARSMQTGQGAFARSMEQGYTARRRAT